MKTKYPNAAELGEPRRYIAIILFDYDDVSSEVLAIADDITQAHTFVKQWIEDLGVEDSDNWVYHPHDNHYENEMGQQEVFIQTDVRHT